MVYSNMIELRESVFLAVLICIATRTGSSQKIGINDEICGTRPAVGPRTRIFNGRQAPPGAWPWVGRLIPRPDNRDCHITLIAEQYATTRYNCGKIVKSNYRAVFGDTEIGGSSPNRQERAINRVFYYGQLAILQLETPLGMTDFVRPVCVPNSLASESDVYDNCWVAGWGEVNANFEFPQFLQEARSGLETPAECKQQYSNFDGEWILCTDTGLNGEPRSCSQDESAPMMCYGDNDRWMLVGLQAGYLGQCGHNTVRLERVAKHNENNNLAYLVNRLEACKAPDRWCNDDMVMCVFEEEICSVNGRIDCPGEEDEVDFCKLCHDKHKLCAHWASTGECEANPDYMLIYCQLSCNVCQADETIPICNAQRCKNNGVCEETGDSFNCRCPEYYEGRLCEIAYCGQTSFEITPGTPIMLQSPLYPENYPLKLTCEYTVTVPSGYKVLAVFQDFDVERGFDAFYIDDSLITGDAPPERYISDEATLRIRLLSDTNFGKKGFELELSALDVSDLDECLMNPCEFDGVCTDQANGYTCQCVDDQFGKNCITPDDYCGPLDIALSEGSSTDLVSFYHKNSIDNKFGAAYGCVYTVTAPQGHQIRVKFNDIDLEYPWDTLQLDKQIITMDLEDFTSKDNTLEIVFRIQRGLADRRGISLVLSDYVLPDVDECASNPCLNGGICRDGVNRFICQCQRGYTGAACQTEGNTNGINGYACKCASKGGKNCDLSSGLPQCKTNSFRCDNQRCVPQTLVCDGVNNCGDGTDEFNCVCEFQCYNGKCLPQRYVCNGLNNCGDWTDEFQPEC